MTVDAHIAERVIGRFTALGLLSLCVHDSFLVSYTHVHTLKAFMR